ncbi:MAG TPA: ABC transporter substrate-binding protein [Sphaerochaeta sp.]|nr:ABC transporter substrate-binding protein [Sphaerochaeta sp.]
MRNIVVLFIVTGMLVMPLFAQGAKEQPVRTEVETKVVIDELGRSVAIPQNPQRVVALTSAVMQSLYNIGIPPVGKVDEYRVTKEGMALPSVGKTSAINIEAVYALNPDLIIASSRFHSALKEALEQSGAAVYFFDPDKVGEISVVDLNIYLGKLLDREEEGRKYVESIYSLARDLRTDIVEPLGIGSAVMIKDGDTITAAQSASSYGSMLKLLGLRNIVPDNLPGSGRGSFVKYSIETILERHPDVVFILASSNDEASNRAMLEKFRNDEQWKHYTLQGGRFVLLPFLANPNRTSVENMLRITADALKKND